ncbi:ATP-binding cassette, subfamily B [Candidatus Kryptonium thompsonii]|jgi:ATP-binding cassette subfamily B protein|uniref:ATP-binding cassette, subfamily B n=3 Tax=Candidatus Kryptonium thompsonii TaxID=1633631 RepID=A0A0P1MY09_9BACT|nr:ABC transporter ATP-binding protein [Candidatus Kryptonium thompsoni]CUS80196.1 ATP-binding cassette, subfamily B [Candidatus Kryptonium thompsoni]CUS82345.1 ATP-binding cassette, subfamily B [Candidatus Kryptonium thompsoni]CUS84755.1 ATP-binding cassette, subfamily B [Candidatus Kryptonium thompsoni]CUS86743.1 ATP-binding cassette, subfamily B [Candidatus Kryptonium thompsoni]CUS89798.1 ATP-binding cassette, subfamily B [Candidatus Kryptonium thompsoni]
MRDFRDDEILGKAYDSRLMKRLLKYVKPYWRQVLISILLVLILAVLNPLRPYITKFAIDDYILKSNYSGLTKLTLLLFGVLFLQGVLQYLLSYTTGWIGQRTIFDLRMEIFNHLQRLALRFFDKNPTGRLVTRVTNDVESLNEMYSSGIVLVFGDIFTILGILYFMFKLSFELSLVTLSVLPLLFYATFLFRKKAREAYREVRTLIAKINAFLQEHFSGISVIQVFHRGEEEFKKFDQINAKYRDANIKSIFYYAVFFPAVELISAIGIGLIIWYGGGEVIKGTVTIGVLISFLQYTEMFFRPVRDLSEKYNIFQTAMASAERIFKLLDTKVFIKQPENPVKLEKLRGEIEFKNVWFAYRDDGEEIYNDDWILKNVSFKINAGEKVAIVGATGSGKSTIINLICKFYTTQKGQILIDGIDIKDIDERELRKHIAVVLQDVLLFSGDIFTNITLGNERIRMEKVIESARLIGADKFIERLPNGYFEVVQERGANLSVGEKQLISFVRALVYDPKILILDEATSSVDVETERVIQNAIVKLLENRTAIIIAHRLSTIQNSDKIIVLHKGEVREIGTHDELMELKGIYYRLYQLQYREKKSKLANVSGTVK